MNQFTLPCLLITTYCTQIYLSRGFGFPRFKKVGQFKSLLFPQFKENPVTDLHIKLPKLGAIPINLHRPIPSGFTVKQVRIIRKADRIG
jgi:putative transposase